MKQYLKSHLIDLFVTLGLVVISLSMLFCFIFSSSTKNMVASIYIKNELYTKIDLAQEKEKRELVIQGAKSEMTLEIDHDYIAVIHSSCPAQTCVHSSPLTSSGTIVCTYNQVMISVGSVDYDVEAR